jgi:hypothetical protein
MGFPAKTGDKECNVSVTGGCLCGAVRYEISAAPITSRACWCRLCQHIGAGSGTVNVCFATAATTIHGQLGDYVSTADSGNTMHRRFCPRCGVHLFSEAEARPHLIFVRAGTLDDPEIGKPLASIWLAQAPTWACIDHELPRFDAQPPPAR